MKFYSVITWCVGKSAWGFNFTESFQLIKTGLFVICFLKSETKKLPHSVVGLVTGSSAGGFSVADSTEACGVWILVLMVCCVTVGVLKLLLITTSGCRVLCTKLPMSSTDDELSEDLGVGILVFSDSMLFSANGGCCRLVGDCGGVGKGVTTSVT